MQTYIGQLHCRYRVAGQGAFAASVTRLERIARDNLLEAYSAALKEMLPDDEAVYVLREINCRLALLLGGNNTDEQLTRRWADGLVKSITQKVSAPDENVMRFENQADYVAHFLTDLLDGTVQDHWYYGSFNYLQSKPFPQVVAVLLKEYEDQSTQILAALHRLNALESLLTHLDPETLRRLGFSAKVGTSFSPELSRPLFTLGLELCDRLDLWAGTPPSQAEFGTYLRSTSLAPDWGDPHGLAMALYEILHFFDRQHYLRQPLVAGFAEKLQETLRDLDWLDSEWLRSRLLEWSSTLRSEDLPVRPAASGLTPRQRLLLNAILSAVKRWGDLLDRENPTSPANLARLAAWLVAEDSSWAGDQAVHGTLSRLLVGWEELRQNPSPIDALHAVQNQLGDALGNLHIVAHLGPPGVAILERLLDREEDAPASLSTDCAGIALLLRALQDARLLSTLENLRFLKADQGAALLLAILLRWAGEAGMSHGEIDPALLALAGFSSLTLNDLYQLWEPGESGSALKDFEQSCLRLLAAQRLLSAEQLYIHLISYERGHALILGNGEGLFPVGRWLPTLDQVSERLAELLAIWDEAEELPESIYVPEELVNQLNSPGDEMTSILRRSSIISFRQEENSKLAQLHIVQQENLLTTISELSARTLGLPQVDLTLGLLAASLLRLWARWLRNFSTSSIPYLLVQFIRRSGQMRPWPHSARQVPLQFELEPRPLDLVLEMAGYLAPLESVSWLEGRRVEFKVRSR